MRIASFQLENYKSFYSSEEIYLTPGFNVVVGPNNAGKTALIEALSLQFQDRPHRSLKTVPHSFSKPAPISKLNISFELSRDELTNILIDNQPTFYVPLLRDEHVEHAAKKFLNAISKQPILKCVFQRNDFASAYLTTYGNPPMDTGWIQFKIERFDTQPQLANPSVINKAVGTELQFAFVLARALRNRIYLFRAERLNIGESEMGPDPSLKSNASNLAQVLNFLQSSNIKRFQRFNEFVSMIFPEIKQITVPPISGTRAHVLVWSFDPDLERDDLAMRLSESGTGIGQVLAILYVVLTSDYPRTIIIDEPQSFLHPGAVRKLFAILKQHPQHQYIVTTHSPTVLTSADPSAFYLVRKEEAESTIETVEIAETQKLRLILSEVGARLSDVFGADNILWVEGRTEELCFPLILSRITKQPLMGTEIIGVKQTGDFEGKHSKTIFDIYRRLSQGRGLLPPAVGFIFDQEGRSKRDRDDLIRESRGSAFFTLRRMYENYLLNPRAIAAGTSSIEGFRDSPVTAEEVEEWLQRNRWDKKYFERTVKEQGRTADVWLNRVHGAKILSDIFKEFSEGRVTYDKIEHGLALTAWLVENAPEDLKEIATLITQALAQGKTTRP